jgi:nitrogen regulatory protein P-II 1
MKEIKAIIKPALLETVLIALRHVEGLPGITISEVKGFGKTRKTIWKEKSQDESIEHENKTKLEIVVPDELAEKAIKVIQENARTGGKGDGKIFVFEVLDVVKIRTGERGRSAI